MFRSSRRFTRGWTLQELLAPATVVFCDRNWAEFATRDRWAAEISRITNIGEYFLRRGGEMRRASVAQRMSWLARRRTARVEDMAYCMFGIFDINLPLLYGEGEKSFGRLQEEIIKALHDHTIFCWTWPDTATRPPPAWMPALAPCPAAFINSGSYVPIRGIGYESSSEYYMTHLGIRARLSLAQSAALYCLAVLEATSEEWDSSKLVAIPLRKLGIFFDSNAPEPPSGPIPLPATWVGPQIEFYLARPGAEPKLARYHDISDSPYHKLANWPPKKLSPFAVLRVQLIDPAPTSPTIFILHSHDSGLVFLQPTNSPSVWCEVMEI